MRGGGLIYVDKRNGAWACRPYSRVVVLEFFRPTRVQVWVGWLVG